MSDSFIIADLHLSHRNIITFKRDDGTPLRDFKTIEEHDETLIENWNKVVKPTDRVYNLGDTVINRRALPMLKRFNGRQKLIRGNHDIFKLKDYEGYFDNIMGVEVKSDMILSHIPLARDCITSRFRVNVHGHLHYRNMNDPAYFCVSAERINFTPIAMEDLRVLINKQLQDVKSA